MASFSSFERRRIQMGFLDPELESAFDASTQNSMVVRTRVAILLGFVLNAIFIYLDFLLTSSTEGAHRVLAIRFGFVMPSLVAGMALTFVPFFKRHIQGLGAAILIVHGIGDSWMTLAGPLPNEFYVLAMVVITVFAHTFAVLRFVNGFLVGASLFAIFEYVDLFLLGNPPGIRIMNGIYVFSINLLGLIASRTIEDHTRREFVQSINLDEEKRVIQRRNISIESELALARNIQAALMPHQSPMPSIAFYYKPMDKLGGDFIDLVRFRGEKKTGVFISDVSGHGVPAAFITAMMKSLLTRSDLIRHDPAAVLGQLNQGLWGQTCGNFVTAVYGIFDPETRIFTFAGAGHPSPFIIGPETVRRLEGYHQGVPLGLEPENPAGHGPAQYVNHSVELKAGEKIFLFTDGLTEAIPMRTPDRNHQQDFEALGLMDAFREFRKLSSAMFIQSVAARLVAFRGADSFEDDVCMICIEAERGV
jgi:serine phosphatase RsbU (regulator of sigma subunit)